MEAVSEGRVSFTPRRYRRVGGGEEDTMAGPLTGVRVVEFAALGAAPYGVMLLADLGADVIRIDRPGAAGDASTAAHVGVARNRRSLTLDLKHPDARAVLDALLASADVLVEGLRPGVMERLGLGPSDLCPTLPRLIYVRMTGWGQLGPMAAAPGHDLNYLALSGVLATIGEEGRPPSPPVNYLADLGGGGTFLAIGVLAALVERGRSGEGQVVDVAMLDGAASLSGFVRGLAGLGAWSAPRGGNLLDGGAPFYATYACADGGHVAVGAIEPQFYAALLEGLGLAPQDWPQHDGSRWPALAGQLAECFARHDRDHWALHFEGTEACVTPVLELGEVASHPHHVARATFVDVPGVTLPSPAPAPRFSRTAGSVQRGPVDPGADTLEVLTELGLGDARIATLIAEGGACAASRTAPA
jgi:alpha-methylacyl-CoA racemase